MTLDLPDAEPVAIYQWSLKDGTNRWYDMTKELYEEHSTKRLDEYAYRTLYTHPPKAADAEASAELVKQIDEQLQPTFCATKQQINLLRDIRKHLMGESNGNP